MHLLTLTLTLTFQFACFDIPPIMKRPKIGPFTEPRNVAAI